MLCLSVCPLFFAQIFILSKFKTAHFYEQYDYSVFKLTTDAFLALILKFSSRTIGWSLLVYVRFSCYVCYARVQMKTSRSTALKICEDAKRQIILQLFKAVLRRRIFVQITAKSSLPSFVQFSFFVVRSVYSVSTVGGGR